MLARFWGVRGSSATPLNSEEIRNRIAAVIHRVKPLDLVSSRARNQFLSALPEFLFSSVGGNTSCIEVRLMDNCVIILDCGTGLREFEKAVRKRKETILEYHIFLSHFHYDHLSGLPYFTALFNPRCRITFYSPEDQLENYIDDFMRKPYHPVGLDAFAATVHFQKIPAEGVDIHGARIKAMERFHPDKTYAYRIQEGHRSLVYSTDTELRPEDFDKSPENIHFFQGTDMLVLDSQYTLGEAINKYSWGHSSYSMAVDFATAFMVKRLFLFHHEPLYSDKDLLGMERSAKWYYRRMTGGKKSQLKIELAKEGHEIEIS
jgi:phosphoribosyl 1,2-cyclic phosphodiesterase